ncbi:hypothetical protein GRJ2_000680700 [Grus japonensis]|uniref:Uncharacterized protein n=1 Tax=Grus japonensis TaxID=30415 RepID=A0ABC9WBH6_GRUJA
MSVSVSSPSPPPRIKRSAGGGIPGRASPRGRRLPEETFVDTGYHLNIKLYRDFKPRSFCILPGRACMKTCVDGAVRSRRCTQHRCQPSPRNNLFVPK